MTSRERVLAALDHRQPDRVPIDLNGHRSSGIMIQAYRNLRQALGLPQRPIFVYDVIQQLALVERDVLDALDTDVTELACNYVNMPEYWREWIMQDGETVYVPAFVNLTPDGEGGFWLCNGAGERIGRQKPGCLYFEQTLFPLLAETEMGDLAAAQDRVMWCAVGSPPAPLGLEGEDFARRRQEALAVRAQSERAVYGAVGCNLLEMGEYCYRMDHFLELLAGEPEAAHRMLDKTLAQHMENLPKLLDTMEGCVDVVGFGDDLGMQTGPIISPRMYREFIKPRQKVMWDYVKSRGFRVGLHSCGGIRPLIPDLIEAGLDCLNPVQITCAGMELAGLKRDFGSELTFWGGGCDTRDVLPHGTPQQVRDHVRRNLDILFQGGGFVFQQVHNIMADVPAENIIAMYRAVREYA